MAATHLTANDSDPEGDPLTITAVGGATNGTVVLNGGNVVFTPTANYNGAAAFTYTLSDGNGTATGTVNVTVNPVNDPPVATNDSGFSTPFKTALNIPTSTLLGNDTDADNETLTVDSVGGAVNGTVTLPVRPATWCSPRILAIAGPPASRTRSGISATPTSTATVSLTVGAQAISLPTRLRTGHDQRRQSDDDQCPGERH